MSSITSKGFITNNFLLQSKVAQTLYHQYAKDLPIIDYHNHLSAQQIAENKPINNITEAWLKEDHYKWRAMRANGIEEKYITGSVTSHEEKFLKWAETVPYTLRNPLFHWNQLELKRYFDIDEVLQPNTAERIYESANSILKHKTPAQLLEDLKVEVVCTTDDPTDDLRHHKEIAKLNFSTKVYPTFRTDTLFAINSESYTDYINKLGSCTDLKIHTLNEFLKAIEERMLFFDQHGCKLSDFGMQGALNFVDYQKEDVASIFEKRLKKIELTITEVDKFRSFLFVHLGKKYHEFDWVQQYHLGALRNNNTRLLHEVGLDAGVDSMGDFPMANFMSKLLNVLDIKNQLAKTIAYNLNPSQNEVFATMLGNFQNSDYPGKMQWGSGWWFLDQKDGIEKQINCLSNMGLLSRFVGMLTDSRSFLSFPRHEYFRRILCNIIGEDVNQGLLPNDIEFLGEMVQNICYFNAKNYFNFK